MAVYEIKTANGSVYEVETREASSEVAQGFANSAMNASKWLQNPIGQIGELAKENAPKLVGAASRFIPFGDEVLARGSALADVALKDTYFDNTENDADYDTALNARSNQVRGYQKQFDTENPGTSALTSIGGALAMPLGSWTQGAKTLKGALLRSIPEGFGYGVTYGFGEGEGTLENRLEKGLEQGTIGAVMSPFATAGIRGASSLLQKAPKALETAGQRQELQAFGATQKNISDAVDRMPDIVDPSDFQNPLTQAVESFKAKGGGKSGMEGQNLLADLNIQREAYRGQVDDLLNEASEAQNFKIVPKFKFVQDYLKKVGSQQKDEAIKIAEEMVGKTLKATKSGKIKAFQNEKVDLGRMIKDRAWGEDGMANIRTDIAKRLYGDLRRTVEESFELFTGKNKKTLTNLNKELGYRENLEPLFKNILKSGEARSPIKSAFNILKTSGGLGQTLIAGAAGGALGPVGMGVGAMGGLYAQTPSGQRDVANLFRRGATALKDAPAFGNALKQIPVERFFGALDREELPPEVLVEDYGQYQNAPEFSPTIEDIQPTSLPAQEPIDDMKLTPLQDVDVSDSRYRVDPALKKAVVWQESSGNAKAESKENEYMKANKTGTAKGLMQLLDGTGKQMFEKYKSRLPEEASPEKYDPYNATQNEILGTKYLEEMLDMFDGDLELALTAYHSGPGTVQKLLKRTKGTKLDDILPHLGKDGKAYARRIIERYKKNMAVEV